MLNYYYKLLLLLQPVYSPLDCVHEYPGKLVRERENFISQVTTNNNFNINNHLQWQAARKGKCPSILATINTIDSNTAK